MRNILHRILTCKRQNIIRNIAIILVFMTFLVGGLALAQNADAYLLGPEDTIGITVIGHPDFSGEFFIPPDGIVTLPAAGKIAVTGKTIGGLASEVIEKLKERLNEPEVFISLKSPRMQRIYIVGAVAKSDSYDMKPGWRITEALAAAGGLEKGISPEDCKVIIFRSSTGEKHTVLLSDVLRGSADANLLILNGDVMTVDPGETFPVYVTGKVKSPGLYRIRKDNPGIMSAITMAGGIMEESASNSIKINHLDGTSEMINLTPVLLEGTGLPETTLRAGDLLIIPEATSRIAVLGFVGQPGFFNLKDGIKVTLADALGMAKGMDNKRAGLSKVVVVRITEGKDQKMVYDLSKFLKKGDTTQNPLIMAGDVIYVPETNKLDFDTITRGLTSIAVILNPFIP